MHDVLTMVTELTEAADAYYNVGDPTMSDADFDALEAQLCALDPANPYFLDIGSTIRGDKVKLPVTMGSLDQVHEGETVRWIKTEKLENVSIVAADKLDGNSILLVYNDHGDLQIAYTRGNGEEGQDVTRHVRQMVNVPKTGVVGVRYVVAEVIMTDATFASIVDQLEVETNKAYKNPRNFVAGQMNKKVATPLFYKHVHIVAFGTRDKGVEKTEQYDRLALSGFTVAGYRIFKGKDLSDDMLAEYLQERHADSDYALDGIVLDVNATTVRDKMEANRRSSSLNPAYAKKFKVGQADNVATSTVVTVHWNVSKDGFLKPRVEIVPVDLVGVTVTFATGFNAKFIVDNKIGPGAEILITRSGDVIPFIKGVVTPATTMLMPDADVVGDYSWTEPNANGDCVDLILDDIDNSDDVKLRRIKQFFSSMSVEFLSSRGLEKLFDAGYTTIESIITAPVAKVQAIVGNANGQKGMASLAARLTNVKPWMLAGSHPAFGRGIGRRKLKKVFDQYGSVLFLTVEALVAVESIEETTALKIIDAKTDYLLFLDAIDGYYSFDTMVEEKVTEGPLIGQYVVFTGVRNAELKEALEQAGAEVGDSKSKMTILIAKDPSGGSSKLVKAREKGVNVIGVDDGWALVK